MKHRDETLKKITDWSHTNDDIRAVLLTSSLVNPLAPVDDLSDLDIELVFRDNASYITNKEWLHLFGTPIAMIEEDESCFEYKHAMKMVLYDDGVKVDFKLFSASKFWQEIHQKELPEDWDIGYQVLTDKDGITQEMKKPTYQVSIIKKPSQERFKSLLNDFWWDTTYVAKCLKRDDLFYAKFMSGNIRTDYLIPLIEWYIASAHEWSITTNKYGRLFKQYLSPEMWKKAEQTFSGSDLNDNWNALFAMADLVAETGNKLSEKLGYPYPLQLETDIRNYLNTLRVNEQ